MFGKFNQNLVSEEYEPPAFGQIDQEKSRTKQIQEQRDRKELLFDSFILDFADISFEILGIRSALPLNKSVTFFE